MSKQIEAMKKLGYSEEEIADMLACDKAIDKGQKMDWDLSEEEHKKAIKQANVGEKKEIAKKPRKAKENPTKRTIIAEIAQFLQNFQQFALSDVEISNPERVICFKFEGNSYEIVLQQKRK